MNKGTKGPGVVDREIVQSGSEAGEIPVTL